jgi:hypothetical protein
MVCQPNEGGGFYNLKKSRATDRHSCRANCKMGSRDKTLTLLSSLTVRCTNYPSRDSRAKANIRRLSAVFSVTFR